MIDYEMMTIPNVGIPNAGMLCLIVSEKRVGLYMSVLEALDKPERIIIHRGINSNEGKLVIEGTEEGYGSIPINYDRKRICFYNKEFVGQCKELVQKYGGGSFSKGVYFTVRGRIVENSLVEFDFHDVMFREVKSYQKRKKNHTTGKNMAGKKKADGKKAVETSARKENAFSSFSMPNMGVAVGGMY